MVLVIFFHDFFVLTRIDLSEKFQALIEMKNN